VVGALYDGLGSQPPLRLNVETLCSGLHYHAGSSSLIRLLCSSASSLIVHSLIQSPICTTLSVYLLDLLGILRLLALTSSLRSLRSRLSIHNIVPPSEATRVVTNESLMVSIMVISAGPEWHEVVQAPREFVTAVRIDSLEEASNDPDVHSQDVQIAGEQNPQDWDTYRTRTEEHYFDWGSVFSSETERRRIRVVDLMDTLVNTLL